MAAARALFESIPLSTIQSVAAEVGVLLYWVRRWKREGDWKKAVRAMPDLSARAGQLADSFKTKMSELGKPLDPAAAQSVASEIADGFAVDVRAQVLDRHRKEWAAPRKIAYDAIQQAGKGDVAAAFERAKLAKITAETLTLVQGGECRAYGINHESRAGDGQTIVVVERGRSGPPQGTDLVEAAGVQPSPETSTGGEGEF